MALKQFPLLHVVEFCDGRCFMTRNLTDFVNEMSAIGQHLMGGAVNVEDLGAMATVAREYLLDQFPWLVTTREYTWDANTASAYIASLEAVYGKMLTLEPLPPDDRQPSESDWNPFQLFRDLQNALNSEDNDDGDLN